DWRKLHSDEGRAKVSLPTYPFERKRCWIEAPVSDRSALAQPAAPAAIAEQFIAEVPSGKENTNVNANPQPPATSVAPRLTKIANVLCEIFEDLSGVDVSKADGSTSFLEMGFDSLFLTQVTQSLSAKFGVKVTFRQLLGDLSSMDALSEFLDKRLPANVLAEEAPAAATVPAVIAVPTSVQVSAPAIRSMPV